MLLLPFSKNTNPHTSTNTSNNHFSHTNPTPKVTPSIIPQMIISHTSIPHTVLRLASQTDADENLLHSNKQNYYTNKCTSNTSPDTVLPPTKHHRHKIEHKEYSSVYQKQTSETTYYTHYRPTNTKSHTPTFTDYFNNLTRANKYINTHTLSKTSQ